ncbi:ABC transporter permease [Salibacterium halotolerans]|uniref:ABC-2 type transport system permease protein n=1 Tax=Salibacterium halotolerans TaxID=1884432 RepID=A0A1I5Y4P7_9BACI|nr:ABC transporter permease [Salibacterium halotolerans]SFQ39149.1 ABC-2 type transport system permease protein [Salibacterium halotolerans]
MRIQRISAIFEKDLKDFMKNMMVALLPVTPVLMALFFNQSGNGELPVTLHYLIVGMTFSVVTSSSIMTILAEENEKHTLRGLIQSPATLWDIIIGKSLVTGLVTVLSLAASLLIVGIEPFLRLKIIMGLILLFLFFLLLGIGVGLFAKSVAETSAYLMLVMVLFGFTPMITLLGMEEGTVVMTIADMFPLMRAIELQSAGTWAPLGVIALWAAAAGMFTFVCFRKVMTDD